MNNAFQELWQQLVAVWKELGVPQRISIVMAGLVVLAGLAGVALWSSREDYAVLYGNLAEAEAAKVITALDESKVPYRVRGGGTISVPADKVHPLRIQLAGKGIPGAARRASPSSTSPTSASRTSSSGSTTSGPSRVSFRRPSPASTASSRPR